MPNSPEFQTRVLGIDTNASVVLATKSIQLQDVISLTTGAMIPFEKGHDQPLTLHVGGRPIATGEAVKVGDKFGIRIRKILSDNTENA